MFTGIIENQGKIISAQKNQKNITFWVESSLASNLKIDQSVAHNGVCLTVEAIDLNNSSYQVTAIDQTLDITTLSELRVGDMINIERAVTMEHRLDGHMVQGHVDQTLICTSIENKEGSHLFGFALPQEQRMLVVPKGSITLDGISLTVALVNEDTVKVAIIPYTYNHTNISSWAIGQKVNVEYDLFGKYFKRYMDLYSATEKR